MQIIIINGEPQSGKTTFENFCVDYLGQECSRFSTIDLPKEIYKTIGWDGTKTPESRAALSRIKDYLYYKADIIWYWINYELNQIQKMCKENNIDDTNFLIFISCREPEQIQRFVDELGAYTLFIEREAQSKIYSNDSDRRVKQFNYDFYVTNNGTIDELKLKAQTFCKVVRGEL